MAFFWISLIVLLGSLAAFIDVAIGVRKIRRLADTPPAIGTEPAKVSIIFSALNEAATIEPALRSLLALDYPDLEIIAIDDRSGDATGEIIDRLAGENQRLRVLHVRELPSGWLGKNHALHLGAQQAGGDYLLFTDADVVFDASALRRAMAHSTQLGIDHLTVFPEVPAKERLLAIILLNGYFALFFGWKPWKVRDSRRHFVGIGAFNLVRRVAYLRAGGHEAIRMEVLDDMMLGKVLKQAGCRQDALFGTGMVSVEWYRNTRAMFKGMQKNSFAIVDYRFSKVITASAIALLQVWPWIGLLVTDGIAWWLNCATAMAATLFYLFLLRPLRWSRWCLVYLPVVSVISLAMLWTACVLTVMRGGVDWRGTRYSLDELRRAHEKDLA